MNEPRPYTPRDLGYPRTPTSAFLRVTFPNGDTFDVPAQAVADSRDAHYADEQEDTAGFIRAGSLRPYELTDWASNNMDWSDLAPYAVRVEVPPPRVDYEAEWGNAEKMVRGRV